MKPLFSRKIKCDLCGSNYKGLLERGKRKYICSRYANYRTCKRYIIDEEFIISLLKRRYGDLSNEELAAKVESIEIFDKDEIEDKERFILTIHLHNDEAIILDKFYLQL